ncbi:hypothetical protein EL18_02435 [Nitratireductor basaltis]|uniref:Uncharacterized protein n=1 Tax=Nitratireductor basaltis TaxID=472175 RepID=A0A084UEK1_9HYPH|nr:hypothetical protein EL18_02435 [Nitratireductor basaltis]
MTSVASVTGAAIATAVKAAGIVGAVLPHGWLGMCCPPDHDRYEDEHGSKADGLDGLDCGHDNLARQIFCENQNAPKTLTRAWGLQ